MYPNQYDPPTQSDGESAPSAAATNYELVEPIFEPKFNKTKCSKCNIVTPHQDQMINILFCGFGKQPNAVDMMQKARRLSVCMTCGNISLLK